MAASVPIPGAIEGSWYKIDCGCWGLLPGWRQQQQLRQRQQRRRGRLAEILLFFSPLGCKGSVGNGLNPATNHPSNFLDNFLNFKVLFVVDRSSILSQSHQHF